MENNPLEKWITARRWVSLGVLGISLTLTSCGNKEEETPPEEPEEEEDPLKKEGVIVEGEIAAGKLNMMALKSDASKFLGLDNSASTVAISGAQKLVKNELLKTSTNVPFSMKLEYEKKKYKFSMSEKSGTALKFKAIDGEDLMLTFVKPGKTLDESTEDVYVSEAVTEGATEIVFAKKKKKDKPVLEAIKSRLKGAKDKTKDDNVTKAWIEFLKIDPTSGENLIVFDIPKKDE